jgi:SAM-dependent methyltransferase
MTSTDDEWFADEEFWIASYPFMFPDRRIEEAEREVEQILTLTEQTAGAVLDLACGPGRHAVALARRGFAVTGVDRSAFLLGKARSRAKELGLAIDFVHDDMRAIRRPATYDVALSLFTSFGFFQDDADNQRVLDNVAESLKPGGVFVLDMLGKEILARIFTPTGSTEAPDGLVIQRRRVASDWSRVDNEWILLKDERTRTFRFGHWIYSAREIEWMFRKAGFGDVRVFGSLAGIPYGPGAERLVVIGTKPA